MFSHLDDCPWFERCPAEQKLNVAIFLLRKAVCQAWASFQEGWQAPSCLVPFHGERASMSWVGRRACCRNWERRKDRDHSPPREEVRGTRSGNSKWLVAKTTQRLPWNPSCWLGPREKKAELIEGRCCNPSEQLWMGSSLRQKAISALGKSGDGRQQRNSESLPLLTWSLLPYLQIADPKEEGDSTWDV